jgi:hypothetical protein
MPRERPSGPEHQDERTERVSCVASVAFGVVFAGIGVGVGTLLGLRGASHIGFAIVMGVASGAALRWIIVRVVHGTSAGLAAFLFPSGATTPYESTLSALDALEAAGDVAGAIAAYDALLVREPANARALRQAAELHARAGQPRRAAVLLATLRSRSGLRQDELYATQRLADLYLGPLGDDGRALVELRRLVERFPGSREAEGARLALARLKRARSDGGGNGASA